MNILFSRIFLSAVTKKTGCTLHYVTYYPCRFTFEYEQSIKHNLAVFFYSCFYFILVVYLFYFIFFCFSIYLYLSISVYIALQCNIEEVSSISPVSMISRGWLYPFNLWIVAACLHYTSDLAPFSDCHRNRNTFISVLHLIFDTYSEWKSVWDPILM